MNNIIKNEQSKSLINRIDGQHNGMGVLFQKLLLIFALQIFRKDQN